MPQKPRFLMIAFSLLSLFVLLLSACGSSQQDQTNQQGNPGTPVKGGTWTDDLYEEPASLIPNGVNQTFADIVDQALYAPLFYGDSNGVVHAGLTTEVPTVANGGNSKDLKTWTFHLRPGLQWSDGQPLDARDVNFTWKLWTNPKFTPGNTTGFSLIISADVSSDNLSITFHLSQSFEPFMSEWVDSLYAPLPAHHFQTVAPEQILTTADNLNPPVTSGPFMMKESKPGDHYTVVRNPKYYRAYEGLPYLNSIVFHVVTDQNTILKDLQAGSIDSSWFLDVTKTIAYKRLSNYTLSYNPKSTNFEAFYFNFHNPILGHDQAVRQAMAMAADRQALIDIARRGQASPLCTDHASSLNPGYQADAPCPKFDPAAANALLDRDGWTQKDTNGYRHKGNEFLDFNYSTTANNLWRADDELLLQQNFRAIGIKLEIQNYPASTFFGTFITGGHASQATGAVSGKYDIAEFENNLTYNAEDYSAFACNQIPPAGSNIDFYCNHLLDKLFQLEQQTADTAARQQVFNQIHQIYLTDFPFVTLYSPVDLAMHKNIAHNYSPGPEGAQEDINVWEWWCNNGQC